MRTKRQILNQMNDIEKYLESVATSHDDRTYIEGYLNALRWVLYKDEDL